MASNREKVEHGFESVNLTFRKKKGKSYPRFIGRNADYQIFAYVQDCSDFIEMDEGCEPFYQFDFLGISDISMNNDADADLIRVLSFYKLLKEEKQFTTKETEGEKTRRVIFSVNGIDGSEFIEFDFFHGDKSNLFGCVMVKVYGRFLKLFEFLRDNVKPFLFVYYEYYCEMLGVLDAEHLTRVDYYYDFYGKGVLEDYEDFKIKAKRVEIIGGHTIGRIIDKEKNMVEVCYNDDATLYFNRGSRTSIIARVYNKYYDSKKKEKLGLYKFLTKDSRRLEFQITAEIIYRQKKAGYIKSKNCRDLIMELSYLPIQKQTKSGERWFECDGFELDAITAADFPKTLNTKTKEREGYECSELYFNGIHSHSVVGNFFNKKRTKRVIDGINVNKVMKKRKIKEKERKKKEKEYLDNRAEAFKTMNQKEQNEYLKKLFYCDYSFKISFNLLNGMTKEGRKRWLKTLKKVTE